MLRVRVGGRVRAGRCARLFQCFGLSGLLLVCLGPVVAADEPNSCETCHSNPDFLVTNKKLYDYFQEWSASVHKQEGVSCDDCHGGDPRAGDAAKAHAAGVKASDPASGIYYKNVPETCGSCHDEILAGFRKSEHFEHVAKKKNTDEQGPTCVTCHGSINSSILDVNSVAEACARCHNEKSDNHPENPEKARAALNRFLSIQRYYRYIGVRAEPDEAREFFRKMDPQIESLSEIWHTFDLKRIDQATEEVLGRMKAKREEIRKRTGASGQEPGEGAAH
jgi:Cytochrome c3